MAVIEGLLTCSRERVNVLRQWQWQARKKGGQNQGAYIHTCVVICAPFSAVQPTTAANQRNDSEGDEDWKAAVFKSDVCAELERRP